MKRFDRQVLDLVRKIDAEKVTVEITFDKASWWQRRRAFPTFDWVVQVEWEDKDEKFSAYGNSGQGGSLQRALDAAEADVNGTLLRHRAGSARESDGAE